MTPDGLGSLLKQGYWELPGPAGCACRERASPWWRQWTPRGHAEQLGLLLPWCLPAACLGFVLVLIPWIAWLFATLPQTELAAHWGWRGRLGGRPRASGRNVHDHPGRRVLGPHRSRRGSPGPRVLDAFTGRR